MSDILQELRKAVLEGEDESAKELAQQALKEGVKPLTIVNEGIVSGVHEAGERWKKNEYFTPDVIMATEAFRVAMEVVEPKLTSQEAGAAGNVVIGTVAGDMHDLGKMIVIAMLRSAGFNVTDLGEDISATTFVDKVRELSPDILGMGCYMTTTMPEIRGVIGGLKAKKLRGNVKVMIGGVPTSQEFADEIGADAWGRDALDAVEKAERLMGVKVK
ncbi:B12-binding domain-containing protein [Chloroflexota bacterium]